MKKLLLPPESLRFDVNWAAHHHFERGQSHFSPQLGVGWVWCVLEGQLEVSLQNDAQHTQARHFLEGGDWIWHPPCLRRWLHVGPNGARWLTLGARALCGERDFFAPQTPRVFRGENAARGQTLLELLAQTPSDDALSRRGLLAAFCAWIWQQTDETAGADFPSWLRDGLRFFEENPGASVAQGAALAHFSPAQFRRLWEKHLGQSPRDFLSARRLERARLALETGDSSIELVARECGFSGAAPFSRAFKNRFGRAPLEWRTQSRQREI